MSPGMTEERFDGQIADFLEWQADQLEGTVGPAEMAVRIGRRGRANAGGASWLVASRLAGAVALMLLAVAMALAVVAIALIGGSRRAVAPPTPSPTPTATAKASVAWTQAAWQPSMMNSIGQVAWTGGRFVALAGGGGQNAFLSSTDGAAWQRQSPLLPASLEHPGDVYLWSLAAGPGGVVAGGLTVAVVGAAGNPNINDAIVWYSPDGTSWRAVSDASFRRADPAGSAIIRAVVPGDGGWFAVGEEDAACTTEGCGLEISRAVVWTSSDGLTWTRDPAAPSFDKAIMEGVAQGGPGYVAVGAMLDQTGPPAEPGKGPSHAAVWTSTDGRSWSPVSWSAISTAFTGATIEGVAGGPGGLVAVGAYPAKGASSEVAWWSADGTTWRRAAADFSGASSLTVAAVEGGYVVIGGNPALRPTPGPTATPTASPSPSMACPSLIWASSNGRTFACVEDAPDAAKFTPLSAASSSGLEVIVGEDASGGAAWFRTMP